MNSVVAKQLSIALIFGLAALAQGCISSYSYQRADRLPLDEVCSGGEEIEGELLLEDECGVELTRLTGESACEAGDGLGCAVAAALTLESASLLEAFDNEAPSGNNQRAYHHAERGCSLGNEVACHLQVAMLFESDSPAKHQQAFSLMDRQCRQEEMGTVCFMLGSVFEENGTTRYEQKEAFDYYELGCEAEDPDACYRLGKRWERGEGTSTSMARARELYGKACELDQHQACDEIGEDPPRDDEELLAEWARITSESFADMAQTGCENGFRHGCTLAGRLIERGELRSRYVDDQRALEFFEIGCRQGSAESCHFQAQMVHAGRGTDANTKTAHALAQRSCEGGYADGCRLERDYSYRLFDSDDAAERAEMCASDETQRRGRQCYLAGQASAYGVNFEADRERARELHLQGCELDYADSCLAAGELYDPDEYDGDTDLERAQALYETACELEAAEACYRLGTHLEEGTGLERDVDRAIDYLERGCALGVFESCGALGQIFKYGDEDRRDQARAEDLFRRGCGGGHLKSCSDMATVYLENDTEESVRQGIYLLQLACSKDEPKACNQLGSLLVTVDDEQLQREAAEHLEKGCLMGSPAACANFGYLHLEGRGVDKDTDKAVQLYEQSCSEDHAPGCYQLGALFRDGRRVPVDAERAVSLFEEACNGDHAGGCQGLASMKLEGRGTSYEPDEALELLERGCELGGDDACVRASMVLSEDVHVDRSFDKALEQLEVGCDAEGLSSCIGLADRTRVGLGTSADKSRADSFSERALEAARSRCEGDEPQMCPTVAHRIAHGRGSDTDFSAAREFLREQCEEEDNLSACREIAEQKATGEIFSRNREAAHADLLDLCKDHDQTYACEQAAFFMRYGYSGELDLTRSVDLYEDLCDDDPQTCKEAGKAYLHGLGVDTDYTRAANLLSKSCDGVEPRGCLALLEARRARDQLDEIEWLYEKSERDCEHNDASGCTRRAQMLGRGLGAERDLDETARLFDRACQMNGGTACASSRAFDAHLDALGDPDVEELAAECTGEADDDRPSQPVASGDADGEGGAATQPENDPEPQACVALGMVHEYDLVDNASAERAAELYEEACSMDHASGCQLRVALDVYERQPLVGDELYDYTDGACDDASPTYCFAHGERLAEHDWDRGTELIDRACRNGMEQACLWLARNGEPVER